MIVFLLLKNKRNPLYKGLRLFSHCDPVGIQTQDLQNRNLTLYSAKLRDHCCRLPHAVHAPKVRMSVQEVSAKVIYFFRFMRLLPHKLLKIRNS